MWSYGLNVTLDCRLLSDTDLFVVLFSAEVSPWTNTGCLSVKSFSPKFTEMLSLDSVWPMKLNISCVSSSHNHTEPGSHFSVIFSSF